MSSKHIMSELAPTFNAVIEPHPTEQVDLTKEPQEPIKPHRQKASVDSACIRDSNCREVKIEPLSNEPYDPIALMQALGAAFLFGGLVGVTVAYAFSSRQVVEYLAE